MIQLAQLELMLTECWSNLAMKVRLEQEAATGTPQRVWNWGLPTGGALQSTQVRHHASTALYTREQWKKSSAPKLLLNGKQ